jgi:phage terminase large subunit GpA-like protein
MRLLPRDQSYCLSVAAQAAAPRRAVSVSEWSDAHRELSSKQAGERGRWRTSRTPFLREIMDCLSATSPVTDIAIMKSSQVGITETIVNWLGYIMDHAPAPTMVFMPTIEARDGWKAQKLNPLLMETPVINKLLGGQRSRDAANRADMIDFPGGILFLAGGNSPNSYAQKSVRNLVMDDLDRFPAEVGREGNPVTLARGRTKAFPRAKRVFVSTPPVDGDSLIQIEFEKSDKRRYNVPCPHCGEWQPLEWGGRADPFGIKWNKEVTRAWYLCRVCACEIYEHQKPDMLAKGRWIAEVPSAATRGYHLTALMAPIGLGPSWLDLAQDWQHAHKTAGTLAAFVNTNLGECSVEDGDQIDPTGLLTRLEEYPEPGAAEHRPRLLRTFGADVQKDRIEVTLDDWYLGEECYTVTHLIIPGDTARPEVWDTLAAELKDWSPNCGAIDSGFNTSMVYAFCEKRPWCLAIKGVPGPGRPIVEDERARRQRLRRQKKKGITVHIVGVDQAKALITSRLKITQPGPGYMHFPAEPDFDDEYFAQLTAEKLVRKIRGTRPINEWVQTRPRNEAIDCKVYSLAALRLSGVSLAALAQKAAEAKARAADDPGEAKPPVMKKPSFVQRW